MTIRRAVIAVLIGVFLVLAPTTASAHSLDSSTLAVQVGQESVDTTVTIAMSTLESALDGQYSAEAATAYVGDHVAFIGADGSTWAETYSAAHVETVEGIESFSLDVVAAPAGADPSSFTVSYDAVIEADPSHTAVVVLTDAAGDISTAGVLTAADTTVAVGGGSSPGLLDMVGHGLHHVLEGADHLLFLITLLLVAPVAAVAGRWRQRDGARSITRSVVGVVTAFTVGHCLTLVASALGWVSLPSQPVEVLIAVSVAVAAVHAVRPLVRHGEELIAGAFGLVHGLAFAGILSSIGLDGTPSVPALLAFNVGVELAQLATVAALFPSLYLLSRTRAYPAVRTSVAVAAFLAATAWALDRLDILDNPLAGVEDTLIAHPWHVAAGLALLAGGCWTYENRLQPGTALLSKTRKT